MLFNITFEILLGTMWAIIRALIKLIWAFIRFVLKTILGLFLVFLFSYIIARFLEYTVGWFVYKLYTNYASLIIAIFISCHYRGMNNRDRIFYLLITAALFAAPTWVAFSWAPFLVKDPLFKLLLLVVWTPIVILVVRHVTKPETRVWVSLWKRNKNNKH